MGYLIFALCLYQTHPGLALVVVLYWLLSGDNDKTRMRRK